MQVLTKSTTCLGLHLCQQNIRGTSNKGYFKQHGSSCLEVRQEKKEKEITFFKGVGGTQKTLSMGNIIRLDNSKRTKIS